jgi:hypothetical protein
MGVLEAAPSFSYQDFRIVVSFTHQHNTAYLRVYGNTNVDEKGLGE